jgi:uracil-DNA glycosylase
VHPEAVIALGLMATNSILHAYDMKTYSVLRRAIEIEEGIRLCERTRLFPVYHCGNKGVDQKRTNTRSRYIV